MKKISLLSVKLLSVVFFISLITTSCSMNNKKRTISSEGQSSFCDEINFFTSEIPDANKLQYVIEPITSELSFKKNDNIEKKTVYLLMDATKLKPYQVKMANITYNELSAPFALSPDSFSGKEGSCGSVLPNSTSFNVDETKYRCSFGIEYDPITSVTKAETLSMTYDIAGTSCTKTIQLNAK